MNFRELMIGDYVLNLCNNKPARVSKVCESYIMLDDDLQYDNEEIAPILLTAEILVDCGYEKCLSVLGEDYLTFRGDCFLLYSSFDNEFSILINGFFINIRYVHDLQHLLRLCHIDRDIIINLESI